MSETYHLTTDQLRDFLPKLRSGIGCCCPAPSTPPGMPPTSGCLPCWIRKGTALPAPERGDLLCRPHPGQQGMAVGPAAPPPPAG